MACPICNKPTVTRFRPFCSARCADVDLAHWLRGDYRIPEDDDENPHAAPARRQDDIFAVDSRDQDG